MSDEKIDQFFGLAEKEPIEGESVRVEPLLVVVPEPKLTVPVPTKVDNIESEEATIIEDDFDFARTNLREVITTINDSISNLQHLAEENESARLYEVLAQMLKNATEANEKLLSLSKSKKEIKRIGVPAGQSDERAPIHVDNAVFVGSTTELHAALKKPD